MMNCNKINRQHKSCSRAVKSNYFKSCHATQEGCQSPNTTRIKLCRTSLVHTSRYNTMNEDVLYRHNGLTKWALQKVSVHIHGMTGVKAGLSQLLDG